MKQENVQKKVGEFMGGKVLDLPEIRLYNQGKAEGKAEAKAEDEEIIRGLEEKNKGLEDENMKLREELERFRTAHAVNS